MADPQPARRFARIDRLPPYVFNITAELKMAARRRGEDIIDMSMGNPDGATPPHIVAKLTEVAQRPDTHGYSASKGIPRLRRAITQDMEKLRAVPLVDTVGIAVKIDGLIRGSLMVDKSRTPRAQPRSTVSAATTGRQDPWPGHGDAGRSGRGRPATARTNMYGGPCARPTSSFR